MKFESKQIIDGRSVITTSKRFLFWKIKTDYEAQKKMQIRYHEWLKLPGFKNVDLITSFQLNSWNKRF